MNNEAEKETSEEIQEVFELSSLSSHVKGTTPRLYIKYVKRAEGTYKVMRIDHEILRLLI